MSEKYPKYRGSVDDKGPPPDYEDPFGPTVKNHYKVICLHCGGRYMSNELVWAHGLWWCKNYPNCDGAGLDFDVLPADEFDRQEKLSRVEK